MTTERPIFVYGMVPLGKTSFNDFYEGGSLNEILQNPGQLRYAGWDLVTQSQARIVKGEYLEIRAGERKLLRLYQDGTFLARVPGDQEFMSWGQSESNFDKMPRLNSLALIEFTFNFVLLCSRLVRKLEPVPPEVNLTVELRNAHFGDKRALYLPGYSVASHEWNFGGPAHPAPEPRMRLTHPTGAKTLIETPQVIAFDIVQKIYGWFGLSTKVIPYFSEKDGTRFIDANLIVNSRGI